ncbi:hypothetical protein PINS_up019553, partial [Pythium insidiosum]
MSFLFRGAAGTRGVLRNVARTVATRQQIRPRAMRVVRDAGGWACTILNSDFSISKLETNPSSLGSLQLSPAILAQLQQHIEATGEQEAFYVVDTSAVEERLKLW